MLLTDIEKGQKVLIKDIKNIFVKNQLNKIGVYINEPIEVSKVALFGSPIAIKTFDTEIAIRKEIAELIEVEPV